MEKMDIHTYIIKENPTNAKRRIHRPKGDLASPGSHLCIMICCTLVSSLFRLDLFQMQTTSFAVRTITCSPSTAPCASHHQRTPRTASAPTGSLSQRHICEARPYWHALIVDDPNVALIVWFISVFPLFSLCRGRFTCMLTNTDGVYFCSVKTTDSAPDDDDYSEPFSDLDAFEISLCHNQSIGSESCELLDEEYRPVTNSKEHTAPFSQHTEYAYIFR